MCNASIIVVCALLFAYIDFSITETPKGLNVQPNGEVNIQFLEEVLTESEDQNYCSPQGLIKDACCDFRTVEEINDVLLPKLHTLVVQPFFRFIRLALYKDCPFWSESSVCASRDCAVETVDPATGKEIPEEWRSDRLGAVSFAGGLGGGDTDGEISASSMFIDEDPNFCIQDYNNCDDTVIVDLVKNPERFTGYQGSLIWDVIYKENCFNLVTTNDNSQQRKAVQKKTPIASEQDLIGRLFTGHRISDSLNISVDSTPNQDAIPKVPNDPAELHGYLHEIAKPEDPGSSDNVCLEKRIFYRLISGLHSSISMHVCYESFNQTTGAWGMDVDCFVKKLGSHPERVQNIYFIYLLTLRAIQKASPLLRTLDYTIGSNDDSKLTRGMVLSILENTASCSETFDETTMFKSPEASVRRYLY